MEHSASRATVTRHEEDASLPGTSRSSHGMSSAARVDSSMPLALDIALEHIGLNNMIEDRPTLLRSRLVCRSWRTSGTFSGKISSVTLRTLADVRLAAAFFQSIPSQRLPWRSVEESCPFPNVLAMIVPDYLTSQLGKCSLLIDLLASTRDIGIHILDISAGSWKSKEMSTLQKLSKVGCSLGLTWSGSVSALLKKAGALTGLTRLNLCDITDCKSLSSLSQLSSLRHLQLPISLVYDLEDAVDRLRICASLTQLARLEFTEEGGDVQDQIDGLAGLVEYLAPASLRDFKTKLGVTKRDEIEWSHLSASAADGVVTLKQCECLLRMHVPPKAARGFTRQLTRVGKSGACIPNLTIHLSSRNDPLGRFSIDLACGGPEKEGVFVIDFEEQKVVGHSGSSGDCNHDEGGSSLTVLGSSSRGPATVDLQKLQMAASDFEAECECGIADVTHLTEQLPTLFPQLQHLELSGSGTPHLLSCIEQLTQLTHLTLHLDVWSSFSKSVAQVPHVVLPSSVRELFIYAMQLKTLPVSNLGNLTKFVMRSTDITVANLLQGRRPPSTGDWFEFQDYLPSLSRLESLEIESPSYDISYLSSLRLLRNLTVALPFPAKAVLTGADALTSLASLSVENANHQLEGFSNLASLAHLRYLKYTIHMHYTAAISLEAGDSKQRFTSNCEDVLQDMCLRMPHTLITLDLKPRW